MKKFNTIYDSKLDLVGHVAYSEFPIDPKKHSIHVLRVKNASEFLSELQQKDDYIGDDTPVKLLNKREFAKALASAPAACLEFDGKYFKIATIAHRSLLFSYMIAWIAPLSILSQ